MADEEKVPAMSKTNVECRNFGAIKLGLTREQIKEEECIEATYDKKAAKDKEERLRQQEERSFKKNVRVFGYKHPKVIKFMSLIIKCLKDCIDCKPEQLNLDMNNFLLLKNELSLAFLRNQDNIVATLKSAIKIYATLEENQKRDIEQQELMVLEKILNKANLSEQVDKEKPE